MKKLFLLAIGSLGLSAAALGGSPTGLPISAFNSVPADAATYSDGTGHAVMVDSTHPLPVAATVTPSGTQDTNLKQVNGATVNVGVGAASTGTQRITTSTDSTIGTVTTVAAVTAITNALPSGTNLMGKVGIDQTTPGTTNAVTSGVSAITGTVSAATITNSSAQYVAAASRRFLAIDNESTTATIACAFGAVAAINTAGSFTIPPGNTRVWSAYPVPADTVNCISSAATSPATVEVN